MEEICRLLLNLIIVPTSVAKLFWNILTCEAAFADEAIAAAAACEEKYAAKLL